MANLKSVLKCWSEFNLPALQKSLDETATQTALRQDEAEKSKRTLIELTKEWRKKTDEDVRTQAAPIIKAFQKEVDTLNKRSKSAENSFLLLYKNLLEIPDPVPVLKQAEQIKKQLEKSKDVDLENQKLRETLDEYHSEFAEVKNQEVTLNKLKDKLKEYEEDSEKKLENLLKEKEQEIQKTFDEREQKLLDTKLQLATKLGDAEAKIKALGDALEKTQSEIFDLKSKHEDDMIGKLSEIEMLQIDLERASQGLAAAEKYSESLQSQFKEDFSQGSTHQNGNSEFDNETIRSLEYQLLSKERELSQLMEEIHHMQVVSGKSKDNAEKEVLRLERFVEEKESLIESIENKLLLQADYEEIKREINVLKMIEFSNQDDSDFQEKCMLAKPLEKLLLEKNKSLQSDCTSLKVNNGELAGKYGELQKNYNEASRTINEQKELITQLEADVMNVRGSSRVLPSSLYRGEGVGAASPSSDAEAVTKAVQDFDMDIVDEMDKQTSESLLPIISSQRERFRQKNLELEAQTRHQHRQINTLQNDVDTVRQDNIKLYEKIKFLQSYPTKNTSTSVHINDDDSVKRYSSQYEERIDPFSLFSKKEKQQRYNNLSAPEKVTLSMGRFILSNKIARTLVFFYTIMLHCLVFVVLYKFAYTEGCKQILTPADFAPIIPVVNPRMGKANIGAVS